MSSSTSHSCPVCFESTNVSKVRWAPCGHGLCPDCVDSLFGRNGSATCPQCRALIRRGSLHQIYLQTEQKRPIEEENLAMKKRINDLTRELRNLEQEYAQLSDTENETQTRSSGLQAENRRLMGNVFVLERQVRQETKRARELEAKLAQQDRLEYLQSLGDLVERAQIRKQRPPLPHCPRSAQPSDQRLSEAQQGRTSGTTSHRSPPYSVLGSKPLNPPSNPTLLSQGEEGSERGVFSSIHELGRPTHDFCDLNSPASQASIPRDTLFFPSRNELSWISILAGLSSRQGFDE